MILLLFNAGPLDVSWAQASPDVQVIMECFISGQGTGDAIARMFMNQGEASVPAGRLPMTWPKDLSQVRVYSLLSLPCSRAVGTKIFIGY